MALLVIIINRGFMVKLLFVVHLTVYGLLSADMFKVESAFLRSYVVLVAIDIYSRKTINFSVRRYPVDGGAVCQMFQEVCKNKDLPKKISTDNDPRT